jgi:V8-like Glu-specific endopeptidase
MTTLTKTQRKQLFEAFLDAFPRREELDEMITLELDRNPEEISAAGVRLRTVVLDVIRWAESNGDLAKLVAGVLAAKPDNVKLRAFAEAMQRSGATPAPAPAIEESYERMVWQAVGFACTAKFRATMAQREEAVCRVEFPEGIGQGTGFLVGPDLVMTCYHVFADVIDGKRPVSDVRFRFDHRTSADGITVNDGRVTRLAAGSWLKHSSKTADLDYVLVQIEEAIGDEDGTNGTPDAARGWLTPEPHQFAESESVFILQHPIATPLKIAAGGVVRVRDTRIHYLANTLVGSSGAPCFTSDWRLAALHRGGDAVGNLGIPFKAILADLRAKDPALLPART